MIKIKKIITAIAFFGVLASSSNLFTDGSYASHKAKKHNHTMHHANHHMNNSSSHSMHDCALDKSSISKSGLASGMTFGFTGTYGFSLNSNSDFITPGFADDAFDFPNDAAGAAQVLQAPIPSMTFNQKLDTLYGASANIGWMMESGIEFAFNLGYSQVKLKDKINSNNTLESDLISGLLNLTYHLDLFNGFVVPYVNLGAGAVRLNAKGSLTSGTNTINFQDLIKITLGYTAGIGLATSIDNVIVGAGYNFFGTASFSDASSSSDLKVSVTGPVATAGNAVLTANLKDINNFSFNNMKINTHNINVFLKFAI